MIITQEIVANGTPTLVANNITLTNTGNSGVRITLGGFGLQSNYGSVTPVEQVMCNVYIGANGLSNDVLVFSQTSTINNDNWIFDAIVASRGTVASNLQISGTVIGPIAQLAFPSSSNGVANVANTGNKVSVYVTAIGGGANGSVAVETGVLANIAA